MKRLLAILIVMSCAQITFSQVSWIKNYDLARAQALSENKFIVMDFWAIWCGPCKKMDVDMWNTSKMDSVSKKFVFLKIDVDSNREIAVKYSANTIPKVIIMDALGNVIWEQIGYSSSRPYLTAFNEFPELPAPTEHLTKELNNNDDFNTQFILGQWYQAAGKSIEDQSLVKGFLNLSDQYYKGVAKKADKALALEAEFNLILNYAYRGAVNKAMKKVEKMDEAEMKNFILAYCYKCEGQTEKMNEFIKKIQSKDLLAQLNE